MADAVELAILLTARDLASPVLTGVTGKFQSLGAAGKLAVAGIGALVGGSAALLGGLTALGNSSAKAAGEVAKLKRETGLTAEEASKFRVIGERMGLGIDDLSKSFGIFSKNIGTNAKAIADNNVAVVTAKDGHVDFGKTLEALAERFKAMPDGVEKTTLAIELFGKGGKDMIPLLNKGRDGLKELGEEAARLGLVFDDKALAAAKRYTLAQKDLSENIEGLKNRIGMAFLPVLADFSGGLLRLASGVLPLATAALDRITGFVRTAAGVFRDMVAATQGKQQGGGDFLASLIGPKAADDFMKLISNVSASIAKFNKDHIQPFVNWAKTEAPKAWETIKDAISTAWSVIEPKLKAMADAVSKVRDKFVELPPAVQQFAILFAASAVTVKATGLDETFGNIGQGISGLIAAIAVLKTAGVAGIAAFAVGALPFVIVAGIVAGLITVFLNWDTISKNFIADIKGYGGPITTVGKLFSDLGTKTKEVFDGMGRAIGDFFSGVGTRIRDFLDFWENAWNQFSARPGYWLGVLVGLVVGFAVNALIALRDFIGQAVGAIAEWVSGMATTIGDFFGGLPGKIVDWVTGIFAEFGKMPAKGVQVAADFGTDTGKTFADWFLSLPQKFWDAGTKAVQGFVDGIKSMADSIRRQITDFFQGLIDGVKEALGIHSPSAVWEDIGKQVMLGFAAGIFKNKQAAYDELVDFYQGLWAVGSSMGGGTLINPAWGKGGGHLQDPNDPNSFEREIDPIDVMRGAAARGMSEMHIYLDGKELNAVVSERQLRDVRLAGGAV